MSRGGGPARAAVVAALVTLYLVWGSTYLAIKFAVATLPVGLLAGARFLAAGALLYVWVRLRGVPAPSGPEWRASALVGGCLLAVGNGLVVLAERTVPSGVTALLIGTTPMWMVTLDWLVWRAARPGTVVWLGLAAGLAGVAVLTGGSAGGDVPVAGTLTVLVATLAWSTGSLLARRVRLPASPLMATAAEMLCGGALLVGVGLACGEGAGLDLSSVSARSVWALAYLVVVGSLVGFSCFVWLNAVTPPAVVSTYAYVNPVVAVLLGWAAGGERVGLRTALAAALIVAGVLLLTVFRSRPRSQPAAG